ncbi:hypothetical protein [Halothermothrix orenii]|nr:hypothetical protein [Halothermothrix orenii]
MVNRLLPVLILLIVILYSQLTYAGDFNTTLWIDYTYLDYNRFKLTDYKLRLPEEVMLLSFSHEIREELIGLASRYSHRTDSLPVNLQIYNLTSDQIHLKRNYSESVSLDEEASKESIEFRLYPGIVINADYIQDELDSEIKSETNIGLIYKLNNRTYLTAEYGLESREWWDIHDIELESDEGEGDSSTGTGEQNTSPDDGTSEDGTSKETVVDREQEEPYTYKKEETRKSRVGISYKTTDEVTISADYVSDGTDIGAVTTVIGVEYDVEQGKLLYKYQYNFGDKSKQTTTGVEVDLNDLATLTASYKLLNFESLEENLKETIWDIGVDLNISDVSSLSVGYQLKDNDETDQSHNVEDEDDIEESNIKAELEIKF